jgi:hypothetical protein
VLAWLVPLLHNGVLWNFGAGVLKKIESAEVIRLSFRKVM